MKRILILGKEGQVGWELQRRLPLVGSIVALNRAECDLLDPQQIIASVQKYRPDIIVNAAAYTAVDKAEADPATAFAINALAVATIAEEAKKVGALLVHYSTDYVFDGLSTKPYLEEDATAPQNIYGQSKLQGEEAIRAVGGKFLIFRTSWVYGSRGKNFLLTMLKLAQTRGSLNVVNDQIGSPTWCGMIAEVTKQVLLSNGLNEAPWGIYHLTSKSSTSWHGFAEEIFRSYHLDVVVKPIPTTDYPTPAIRPLYSVLDTTKIEKTFGISLLTWQTALNQCREMIYGD